jgi:hypothetical protein
LKEIPGVFEINPVGRKSSEDLNVIEITVRGQNEDIRPLISDLVVKSGARLYSIKQGENMLERAYIEALRGKDGGKH